MRSIPYRLIREGIIDGKIIPVSIIFADIKDISSANITQDDAIRLLAQQVDGPCAINLFDMDAVTTTSDGIMTEGAIVCMGASDRGRVNADFGILPMAEIEYDEEMIAQEPHLIQWKRLFPGRKLFRGPDPAQKRIPVHNVVISGRASNNNSATEMMNIITMEELLFPILGQLECINDGDIIVGYTGEHISVGIGMTVAEKFGRVFPHPQFEAGTTAHNSGKYAKTLKKNIPCIVSDKKVIAACTIRAIECGCIPARHIGCSPVVLAIARALGSEIDFSRIQPEALDELDSVGCTWEWMHSGRNLSKDEVIANADEILPGVEDGVKHKASDILTKEQLQIPESLVGNGG